MDYRDMYFELFRAQADAIKILEQLTGKLKIAHLTAEEMVLSAQNDTQDSVE